MKATTHLSREIAKRTMKATTPNHHHLPVSEVKTLEELIPDGTTNVNPQKRRDKKKRHHHHRHHHRHHHHRLDTTEARVELSPGSDEAPIPVGPAYEGVNRAIKESIQSVEPYCDEEAPVPMQYDEMEEAEKKKPEDDSIPLPVSTNVFGRRKVSNLPFPVHVLEPPPVEHVRENTRIIQQSQEISTPPIDDNASDSVSVPILEATLVENQDPDPPLPIYNAVAVHGDDHPRSWWKRNQILIIVVLVFILGVMTATIASLLVSRSSENSENDVHGQEVNTITHSSSTATPSTLPLPTTSATSLDTVTQPSTKPLTPSTIDQLSTKVWKQQGQSISGDEPNHWFGTAAGISGDGTIIAVGAYLNGIDLGNGELAGQVRIHQLSDDGLIWNLLQTFQGETEGGWFGHSVGQLVTLLQIAFELVL